MTPRQALAVAALGLGLLLVPDSQVSPAALSLVAVDQTTRVEFGDGVVVVLALGSDARPGEEVLTGNADAIELIALNFETGQAAAVGIPRDTWVVYDEEEGEVKLNDGLHRDGGGPQLMASKVAELTGVTPQYVFTTGLAGFESLVGSVGELVVRSETDLEDEEYDLDAHAGPGNRMNALQATGFVQSRNIPRSDFARMANGQHLLQAILNKLRAEEDTEGFIENGALSALKHLDTGLSPAELYRFAQAISQLDPAQTSTCVITGSSRPIGVNLGLDLAPGHLEAVAADAVDDGHLEPGTCAG